MTDDIRFYLSLLWRRLPVVLCATLLLGAAGTVAALRLPPVFSAEARLVVEAEKIPDELAASTVRTQAYAHLEIIEQRLLSRESLLDLSSRLAIYGNDRPTPDAIVQDLRSRISYEIEGEASPRRGEQTATMLRLAFEDRDPSTTATVVNELVSLVLAEDVTMRTDTARQTLEFFEREVSRLEDELSRSGATLLAFRQENLSTLPETSDARRDRLLALEGELSRIERDAADLMRERDRLTRVHEANRRRMGQAVSTPTFEERQLQALRETLEGLPADDPGAGDLERRIAALEERLGAAAVGAVSDGVPRSAYHARIEQLDERLRALDDLRREVEAEVGEIQRGLSAAPVAAADLATLERDHATLRTLYDQAIEAKAIAETGDAIEALSKGQRIAIIEQAVAPRLPSGPDRPRVALMGVGAGLALGLLIALWLEMRLGFLRRPVDIERRLGIQPIATLPLIALPEGAPDPDRRFWRRARRAVRLRRHAAVAAAQT